MKIHKEGYNILLVFFILIGIIDFLAFFFIPNEIIEIPIILTAISAFFYAFCIFFFRVPNREIQADDRFINAPADGKIVVIEETNETEYFKDKRIQVSIFMSPLNVHINWFPISGVVKYCKYHKGKYLVAWHPKSSILNERNTVVVENKSGIEILFRQIAGTVARRIVCFAKENQEATQGKQFGLIKFGSRVDIFLPKNVKIKVKVGQKVTGNRTVIAEFI